MPHYKVIFEIEKIVECESRERAVELARSDVAESDLYNSSNYSSYELTSRDMNAAHNRLKPIVK